MRNTALARLAILATLSCTACDVLDPAEGEVDETRAGYPKALYAVPVPVDDRLVGAPHTLAVSTDGSYAFDDETMALDDIANRLQATSELASGGVQLDIPAEATMAMALPLFQLLEAKAYYGVEVIDTERLGTFDTGLTDGEHLGRDSYFSGTVRESELPVFVRHHVDSDSCTVTFNGRAVNSNELYDSAFMKLDTIVQRAGGVEAIMADEGILDSLIATVQSPPETPWRCIAGVTFNLQAAGWPFIRYELVTDD